MNSVYWDSCVFISRIQRDPSRIAVLEAITDDAAKGELRIVTSAFTIAEVRILDKNASAAEIAAQSEQIQRYFDHEWIHVVQVNREVGELASDIGRKHNIKPPDAVHLATAIYRNVQVVHTYDGKKLLKLDGQVGSPPLTIIKPWKQVQLPLFDESEKLSSQTKSQPDSGCHWLVHGRTAREISRFRQMQPIRKLNGLRSLVNQSSAR